MLVKSVVYYAPTAMFSFTFLTVVIFLSLVNLIPFDIFSGLEPKKPLQNIATASLLSDQPLIPNIPTPTLTPLKPSPTSFLTPTLVPTLTPKVTRTPTPTIPQQPTSIPPPQDLSMGQKIILLLNDERASKGLPPLKEVSLLGSSAQAKAQDMLSKNYWNHTSPAGIEFWKFFESSGYNYLAAGENLAKGYFDAQSLTSGWMNSESHKNNILNSSYQEVGIGIVDGIFEGFQTKVIVAHFAQPA